MRPNELYIYARVSRRLVIIRYSNDDDDAGAVLANLIAIRARAPRFFWYRPRYIRDVGVAVRCEYIYASKLNGKGCV